MSTEREEFEAHLKGMPDWAPEFEVHRHWVEKLLQDCWQAARRTTALDGAGALRMAKAALTCAGSHAECESLQACALGLIDAALASAPEIPSAQPAPEGWKLVPVEPTREMVTAGARCASSNNVWRAMLAAAPAAPSPAQPARETFEAHLRAMPAWAPEFEVHRPWVEKLLWDAWQAAPVATQPAPTDAQKAQRALQILDAIPCGACACRGCEIDRAEAARLLREALSAPVGDGDLLLQAIQKLNQNPYSLTKGECIAVLEKLRATQPGKVLIPIAPDARKGQAPCGECHLSAGETCDICGAKEPATQPEGQEAEFNAATKAQIHLIKAIDAARSAQAGDGKP